MTELYHHGVKGMKWGVRRYRNKDGSYTALGLKRLGERNLKKARTANLEKWGKSADTNVLYISGYSGSGKSTTALSMKRPGDKVIHLDAYSEFETRSTKAIRDKSFDRYLDKKVPNWKRMMNATEDGEKGSMIRNSSDYWKTVDKFREAITSYSKEQYKNGHRVIVEGVQIADDWLAPNKKFYDGKPGVVLGTGVISSMSRAFERDGRGNLIKGLANLDSAKDYVKWFLDTNAKLDDLAGSVQAKRGEEWVKKYLKQGGI